MLERAPIVVASLVKSLVASRPEQEGLPLGP